MAMFDGHRPAGREHIPVYPVVYRILRAIILPVTLIVLGLDAYGLSYLAFSGNALMMFTCVASLITCIYYLVSFFLAPAAYNYWALLGLDILNVVFWLIAFALLASQVAPWMSSGTDCYYGYCYSYGLYGSDLTFAQCLLAAAGLGGLCFLLYGIVLVFDSLALIAHRRAGYHCQPGVAQDPEKAAAAAAATASSTPAPIAQPAAVPLQNVAPVPYYEQQAAAQQAQAQQPFYGTPTPSAPTPVSYVQSPADASGGAYYAQPPQQAPQQVPQQAQPAQYQVQQPPAQYYEAAAAPVQTQAPAQQ